MLFLCTCSTINWMITLPQQYIIIISCCTIHTRMPYTYTSQTQVHDLKQSQSPSTAQLHSMLMDPAVNLMFLKMKSELKDVKEKLAQAQTDLSAWKFSTDRSVGTAAIVLSSIVRKRPVTKYYCIDRSFMTCLLYHMICMLCHTHRRSHELSLTHKVDNVDAHGQRMTSFRSLLFRTLAFVLCSGSSPLHVDSVQ